MGDGFESFEINDFDLENAFNPLKRRRFTKHQQTYGVFADDDDESGSDGDDRRQSKMKGKKSKDYSAPVNFISGGVKEGDKIKPNKDDPSEPIDDDNEDEPIHLKGFSRQQKSVAAKKPGKKTPNFRNEMFAGFRGAGGASTSAENFADWEKYTKGIGSKLLSKMGHKQGLGLGREGQGIAEPIKAALRPGRGAVGLYGPEVKGPKIRKDPNEKPTVDDLPEEDEEEEQSSKRSDRQKGKWRKEGARQKAPKYKYKTWDEVVAENSQMKKSWPANQQSSVKIIDMTGREQKVYSDYEEFKQSSKTPSDGHLEAAPDKQEKRSNFDMPELRHNVDLLVDMTEETIIRNDRQLKFLKDQNVALARDEAELCERITNEESEREKLKNLLELLDRFEEKVNADSYDLEDCKTLIKRLQDKFYTEYKMFGLSDIAFTNVLPLIKRYFYSWQPLEMSDYGLELLREWKNVLEEGGHWASSGANIESMDPFHRLIWEGWMPQFRRAALKWEPRNADEMINLLESWMPVLPTWVLENILEQIILPRLQNEVENWDPTTDTLPIHSWLHPWLPLMGDRLQPVYAPIRHKLSRALAHWHPRDPSAKMILKPWMDVFASGTMDAFLSANILPKLEACMSNFVINPANQLLDAWRWIMDWLDMISAIHIANLLVRVFFPKWHEVLFTWLNCSHPNYAEISQWYSGWKSLFPEDLLAFQTVKDQFNRALEMMNRALTGAPPSMPGPSATSSTVPEHVHQKNLNFLASRSAGPSAPANFKDLLDMKSAEYNILFIPIPNKFREGKPVYKFGPCQIFIDRNVIFVLQNNQWLPVSLEKLISVAIT